MSREIDVAIASCKLLPEPDPDARPLLQALRDAGLRARVLAWDDPGADFASARVTLLRSTWNYPDAPDGFRRWLARAAEVSELWNPLPVVLWNLHKSYLLDLERASVPVVPTCLVHCGDTTGLAAILARQGWSDVVIKPAISAASRGTLRVQQGSLARGEEHLRALAAEGDALVQQYQATVDDYGERAIVWIDGDVTHAVRKSPRFSGGSESVSAAVPIKPEEADVARRAIAFAPQPILYARVDVITGLDGVPRVMELELIEPSLFLPQSPEALESFVQAVIRILRDQARALGGV